MKKQILVVDNSQNSFYEISTALEHECVELFRAQTVAEALNSFINYNHCLVFVDIHLPWKEKIELVRIMKSIKTVPIIVFSGPLSKNNMMEMFQAGASIVSKDNLKAMFQAGASIVLKNLLILRSFRSKYTILWKYILRLQMRKREITHLFLERN